MSKILIVEDEKFLRTLMTKKLDQENFDTITAVDGEEALKKIKKEKPDLVLLDILLPSITGWEVLKKIKKDPKMKDLPVLMLTNLGEKEDVEKGLEMGASDYIIKAHFTPSEIVDKVRKYLSQS